MTNEPSRSELEKFLLDQYTRIRKLCRASAQAGRAGAEMSFRGAQNAHGSSLFYLRTGLMSQAEPDKFAEFMRKLNKEVSG